MPRLLVRNAPSAKAHPRATNPFKMNPLRAIIIARSAIRLGDATRNVNAKSIGPAWNAVQACKWRLHGRPPILAALQHEPAAGCRIGIPLAIRRYAQ
jgi:hypothetical protein